MWGKQSAGCLRVPGAAANCPELPLLPGRRQGVTSTYSHSAHMQQSPRSHEAYCARTHQHAELEGLTTKVKGKRGIQPSSQEKYTAQTESLGTAHRKATPLHGVSHCAPDRDIFGYVQRTFYKSDSTCTKFSARVIRQCLQNCLACGFMKSPFELVLSNPSSIVSHCSQPATLSQQKLWSKAIRRFQIFFWQ